MTLMRTKSLAGVLPFVLVATALLLAPGCGHRRYHDNGDIVLANQTNLLAPGPMEDVVAFRVAPFRDPFGADLLGGIAVPPDSERFLGTFDEDYYDGLAELVSGVEVEWQDEWVGDDRTTTFEVR